MADYLKRDSVLTILRNAWNKHTYADDAMQAAIDLIGITPAADVIEKSHIMDGKSVCMTCENAHGGDDGKNEPFYCECIEYMESFGMPEGCYRYHEALTDEDIRWLKADTRYPEDC